VGNENEREQMQKNKRLEDEHRTWLISAAGWLGRNPHSGFAETYGPNLRQDSNPFTYISPPDFLRTLVRWRAISSIGRSDFYKKRT
jgi:hypothetical protein